MSSCCKLWIRQPPLFIMEILIYNTVVSSADLYPFSPSIREKYTEVTEKKIRQLISRLFQAVALEAISFVCWLVSRIG